MHDDCAQTGLSTLDNGLEEKTWIKTTSDVTQTSKWLALPPTARAGGAMPSGTVGPLFCCRSTYLPPCDLDPSLEHIKCFRRGSRV